MIERLMHLAEANNCQTLHLFQELEKKAHSHLSFNFFSVMEIDFANEIARRIYSSSPQDYPISGTKPIPEGEWADIVIHQQKIFVANDYTTIAKTFPDHALIRSLGCEAIINVPIIIRGVIHGTLNFLGPAGAYPAASIRFAEGLKIPGIFCLLFNQYCQNGSEDD